MINLRYHIVSLVAVFLALGLGVIAGSTVIDQQIVKGLQRQRADDRTEIADLRRKNDGLRAGFELWERFGETLLAPKIRDVLRGNSVLVIAAQGAPAVDEVGATLARAGATVAGRLILTKRLRLADTGARADLARALGTSDEEEGALKRGAAEALGRRLRTPADARNDGDVLRALEHAGFLSLDDLPAGDLPARGSLLLFLNAGNPDTSISSIFAVQLLEALGGALRTAVAEPLGARDSLVDRVRGDGVLSRQIATVDDVDTTLGRFSVVWALHDVAAGAPPPHYGVRRGATAVVPPGVTS